MERNIDESDDGRIHAVDDVDYFDEELISLLAAASQFAYDCFREPAEFEYPLGAPAFQLLKKYEPEGIGCAFLSIQYGEKYAGKVIFAIRGMDIFTKKPNVSGPSVKIMYSDETAAILTPFNAMEAKFCEVVRKKPGFRPDFVTGHSLGGTMAEIMCARHGIPGASFAAPGPYSSNIKYNLIHGLENHKGVPFRSVVNPKDRFPTISRDQVGTMLAIERKLAKKAKDAKKKFVKTDMIEFYGRDDTTVHDTLEKNALVQADTNPTTDADRMHIVKAPYYVQRFGASVQESHSCVGYCEAVGSLSQGDGKYKKAAKGRGRKVDQEETADDSGEDDLNPGGVRIYANDDPAFFGEELISILAAAAKFAYDCFMDPEKYGYPHAAPAFEVLETGNPDEIGYAFFRIKYGKKYANKVIFAIRGTVPFETNNITEPDLAMFMGNRGVFFRSLNKVETEFSQLIQESPRLKPDFVTGHSLGGTVAEVMCARHGIPGASFAAPGPYSANVKYNLIHGLVNHNGVPFRAVVNSRDKIPNISRDKVGTKFVLGKEETTDADLMHIVRIPHYVEPFGSNAKQSHSASRYARAVGELKDSGFEEFYERGARRRADARSGRPTKK